MQLRKRSGIDISRKNKSATIFIITGAPCTGKTTIAEHLASTIQCPLFTKDCIKESLFDALGGDDREWSRRLSNASYAVMFHLLTEEARARRSVIVEANFKPERHNPRFRRLRMETGAQFIQIYVSASATAIKRRLQKRARKQIRHPGHQDSVLATEIPRELRDNRYAALNIEGELIRVDTTDSPVEDLLPTIRSRIGC